MKPHLITLLLVSFFSVVSVAQEALIVTHATLIDGTDRGPQQDMTLIAATRIGGEVCGVAGP